DVVSAGQTVIKKGDALGGMWGGRRASSTNLGELLVTLTSVNGQNVVAGRYSQVGSGVGQDTWVSAGALISFMTCGVLNKVGGCGSLSRNQAACTSSGGTLIQNGTTCSCPAGKIFSNGSGGAVLNGAVCVEGPIFYRTACSNS